MDDIQSILNAMIRERSRPQTAAVAIAVIGLNIHFGYTGLLNIGQAGFMLLGAYGFAISITQGWPLMVGLLVGLAVAFVFALVLGMPTLKLRGDYLAIVTISAAEIVRYVGRSVGSKALRPHRRRPGHPRQPVPRPVHATCPSSATAAPRCSRSTTSTCRRLDRRAAHRLAGRDRPDLDGGADRPRQDGLEGAPRTSRWSA